MSETLRAQVYYKDGGLLRKSYIQHMTKESFDKTNESKCTKAIELTSDDWYGEKLPATM
jgi:hypothetical protein